MSRSPVQLRLVRVDDAPRLAMLWADVIRRGDIEEQTAEVHAIIDRVLGSLDERIMVADYDGELAGAVLLRAAEMTPLNSERVVQAVSPHVFPEFRRHGVGHALMEAVVSFADELGIAHVASASITTSRDANRFLARLGLGPQAILRVAPTHAVRAKLTQHPMSQLVGSRQLDRVLVARRVLRRERALG